MTETKRHHSTKSMMEWIHKRNPIYFTPDQRNNTVQPEEGIIYLLTNRVNGKKYVGQAKNKLSTGKDHGLEGRWVKHVYNAQNNKSQCKLLEQAIREFGPEAFSREVIASGVVGPELNLLEEKYIKELHSRRPKGYNILMGKRGWQSKAKKRNGGG